MLPLIRSSLTLAMRYFDALRTTFRLAASYFSADTKSSEDTTASISPKQPPKLTIVKGNKKKPYERRDDK